MPHDPDCVNYKYPPSLFSLCIVLFFGSVLSGCELSQAERWLTPDPRLGSDLTALVSYTIHDGELTQPIQYQVSPEHLDAQADRSQHEAIWNYARAIFTSQSTHLRTFTIFTDGEDEAMASVFQMDTDPYAWTLAVDIYDAFDAEGELFESELQYTLVHEFGHLLSLNPAQVRVDESFFGMEEDELVFEAKKMACETLFLQEGCTKSDSLINQYYALFWLEIQDEFEAVDAIEDDEARDEAKAAFFESYSDQFITPYAATNVTEDFAESWTHFILYERSQGDRIVDEKIEFFYDSDALQTLRDQIRSTL